jgi:two-component system chemotaxis response regulator CheB
MAYRIVVIGTSLGGLHALETLLPMLPAGFPLPVVVVQHRSVLSGEGWVRVLQRHSLLKVREPQDKEPILPGRLYLAPPDYHLLVDGGDFALSTEGPVLFARPSIDVLFESVADTFGPRAIGVVLTGASDDGSRGAARLKRRGGCLIIQDPATAEAPTMPKAALTAAPADHVLPLEEIGPCLCGLAGMTS